MKNKFILFRRITLSLMFFLIPLLAAAQTISVQGTVKDSNDEPLIGVSVAVEGTNLGTITDHEGKYTIKASPKGNLIFSYLGFVTSKALINNRTTIDVVLSEDTKKLDEVVVVGYGTMKRSDFTGAVSSIGADAVEKSVATTIDQVLQGRIAGMQVAQNSGIPGGSTSILIRGINSINSTNEPIYVVDGMIINGETGSNTSNAISNINPADIESVEVLKDASATAIYGAQGANGVIIITMKKGKEGIPKINFNAYYGIQEPATQIDMMNLQQYAVHYNDLQTAFGYLTNRKDAFSNPETLGNGTNWQDAIFRNAPMQSYNLSVRGGNKVANYSVSGGYMKQEGITVSSGFDRATLRIATEIQAREWVKMGATINSSYTNQESGIAGWNIIPNALYQSPQVPVYNADGSFGGPDSSFDSNLKDFTNPLAIAELTTRDNEKFGTRGNLFLTFKPTKYKWINFRTEFTGDAAIDNYIYFLPSYQFGSSTNAYATNRHDKTYTLYWGWKNMLNFDKTFNKVHKVTAMIGQEVTSNKRDYLNGQRLGGSDSLQGLDAGDANYATNSGYGYERRFSSIFGRAFYSYKDKYLFTGTIRHDGSSNFAEGEQWGTFPSAAIAWRASEESFFKPLKDVMNNLKFRLSYGEVGNSNVAQYAYISNLTSIQSPWGVGLKTGNIPNPNLTWETTRSWNAGIDMNFLDNRIEFIVDAYVKNTNNLLMQLALPGYVGTDGQGSADAPWYNIGSLQNKGFEFTLNTVNIQNRKFNWKTGITFSLNQNEITEMNTQTAFIDKTYALGSETSTITRTAVGHPISQFYGFNVIGRINSAEDFLKDNGDGTSTVTTATRSYKKGAVINNTANNLASYSYIGDLLYEDVDGDGIITDADRTYIGSPLPDFTFGINNSFRYRDFDLTVFLYGSVGNKAFNWLRRRIDNPNSSGNVHSRTADYCRLGYVDGNSSNKDIWNIYVLPGADDSQVRMGGVDPNTNSAVSSRFVEDASFLRIQNISLGYTVPKRYTAKLKIESLRFYANLQNVYTFTKYTGYDPEVGSTQGQYSYSGQSMLMYGVDTGRIPSPRIYTFGLDLTF